ncbi:hypothetical protein Q4489_04250 [Thalassotalea sp. 1_MG-2023]|uniref:hypothetical protein n=1 Tax=Thalassotalea sp. 1_MG-2023 TaxID=3062680 RepID=UPI0026E43BE5|nr:hypothetical protein [Thalassotalea sp. 1_MG-2023]MDO6426208.1 hypothetical protein [Thalassotalea sp. 1_MG-2023]
MSTPRQEACMRKVAQGINEALEITYGQKMGFVLVATPFNESNAISDYIGNIDRENVIELMRETADRLEQNQTIPATQGEA